MRMRAGAWSGVLLLILACSSAPGAPSGAGGAGAGPDGGASVGAQGGLGSGGGPNGGGGRLSGGAPSNGGGPAPGGTSSGGSGAADGGRESVGGSEAGGSGGGSGLGGTAASSGGEASAVDEGPFVNGLQWADTRGEPIQAHGGGMLKVGEYYYWFGENRNPDSTFLAVSVYRSKDLRHFEFRNDVLTMASDPELRPANIERPKVVFNESTGKYVMWMHWENGRDYGEARAAVASSDTVDGDYTYHGSFRPLAGSGVMDHGKPGYMSRDCTLYVDDDKKAYFLSAADENYDLNLYLLTPDYLSVDTLAATLFPQGHREAPALFKRNGTYFLVTSGATGWNPNQGQYATSASLTSGWSSLQNVGDGTTFSSQSTYVLPVSGEAGTEYLYLGDRWAGAYGGRVNDSQYVWLPITFSSATQVTISYQSSLALDTNVGQVRGSTAPFRLKNKKSGLYLDTEGGAAVDGTPLVMAEKDDATAQSWTFVYNGSGHFELHNEKGEQVLDVPDESTESGVQLKLYRDVNGPHQGWLISDLGGGEYRLRNQNSGHFLSVAGASALAGATLEQRTATSGDEQIWHIELAP